MRWWVGAMVTVAVVALVLAGGPGGVRRPALRDGSPGTRAPGPTAEEEGHPVSRPPGISDPASRDRASLDAAPQRPARRPAQRPAPRRRAQPAPIPVPSQIDPGLPATGRSGPASVAQADGGAPSGEEATRQALPVAPSPAPGPSAAPPPERPPAVAPLQSAPSSPESLEPQAAPAKPREAVLTPPVLLSGSAVYPGDAYTLSVERSLLTPELRLSLPEGRVVLRVLVRADGAADRVEVAVSSGHPVLDRAAADAAQSWRFSPATRNGEPIAAWAVVPVRFVVP